MPQSIEPVRVNHINMVLADFDASIAHFRDLYDADFLADYPQKEWHAGLFEMGGVIFEPFVPPAWLLNARHGPYYLGIEYQADMEAVRAAIADHGIRIVRDICLAVHTHPTDTLGVAFEFYDGSFHDRTWDMLGGTMKPASYWRDEHGLGLTGLKVVTIVVEDMEVASGFLTSFLSARLLYDEVRLAAGAQARGFQVADSVVELLVPTGAGPIRWHLDRHGPGIRSTVLSVRDIDQARRYFAARGMDLVPGDRPDSVAVPAEANMGVMMEFAA
ncbi:VOC family protein [Sphingobium sufflavum]|uniref:VOC family protein n=1 Tax=Sphingobium sufflavum TaxID=1129547 RepID=UPI001F42B14C|nr:VOC family protein [Sphingobium sufflavum]MCE7795840.1 VOC family protein [Sphingobium sufflavum]